MRLPHRDPHRPPVHRRAGQGRVPAALHRRVVQRHHRSGDVAMSEDEKNPAREVISTYAQANFRYFRTADGTVY
ncbi:ATP-binding protein, partial [Streptomyces zaomyceticus]